MRACVLAKRGDRTIIETRTVADPRPGPGEAVLEVRAAALNHLDLYALVRHRAARTADTRILGSDAAGIVVSVGENTTRVSPGDEVVLDPGLSCGDCERCAAGEESECARFDIVGRGVPGTFAERVTVPEANLSPKPTHLDFEQAAALCLDHLTAWRMVRNRGHLEPGETVLIHGIGGGAALAALQIAKLTDAWVVVTSSSDEKLARARELGADAVVNYREHEDVAREVRGLTEDRGVDLVIDSVGATTFGQSIAATRNGGRVVVCGATTGANVEVDVREIFWRQVSIIGSTMGSREDFRRMLEAATEDGLVPVVDSVWPMTELEAALSRLEEARQFGKIVLRPRHDDDPNP